MSAADSVYEYEVNNKWVYAGTLVHEGVNGRQVAPKTRAIHLHKPEGVYVASVALSMLSAPGGEYDEDDTVYTDIYSVDGNRLAPAAGTKGVNPPLNHPGYVYDHHFGPLGDDKNQGPSSFVGMIKHELVVRLFIQGDDWAAASYTVIEL